MDNIKLEQLEQQVIKLMQSHSEIVEENKLLHKRLAREARDKTILLNEKDAIASKLKSIISQIKERIL